jgi:hypothetical protein
MNLPIEPHVGVGPVRFGMTRADVRRALGGSPKTYRKTTESITETDFFPRWRSAIQEIPR